MLSAVFEGTWYYVMERPNIQIRKILRSPSVKRKNKTVPVSERVSIYNGFNCKLIILCAVVVKWCENHNFLVKSILSS